MKIERVCNHDYHSIYHNSDIDDNPECYGLKEIDRLSFTDELYEFDYRVVWQDKENRLWTARDYGCSCPKPFEDVTELERLTSIKMLQDEYIDELTDVKMEDWLRFRGNIERALCGI